MSLSIDRFLSKNVTDKMSKSSVPDMEISVPEIIDELFDELETFRKSKERLEKLQASVVTLVTDELYSEVVNCGEFHKSFNVKGTSTDGIQITYRDVFSKISFDKKSALKSFLGKKYDECFHDVREISVRDTTDETITLLRQKLGDEDFRKIFKIELSIATNEGMDKKQFSLPDTIKPFLVQSKPSIKVLK